MHVYFCMGECYKSNTNYMLFSPFQNNNRIISVVVKASASRVEDPGFESCLRMGFCGVKSYQ